MHNTVWFFSESTPKWQLFKNGPLYGGVSADAKLRQINTFVVEIGNQFEYLLWKDANGIKLKLKIKK